MSFFPEKVQPSSAPYRGPTSEPPNNFSSRFNAGDGAQIKPPQGADELELLEIQQMLDALPKPVGPAAQDTAAAFLSRVLPTEGVGITLSLPNKQERFFDLSGEAGINAMTRYLLDARRGFNVYQALASFKNDSRKATNALKMHALWADIDLEPASAAYLALKKFCTASGVPWPSYVIGSGGGIHAYWIFDDDIDPATWKRLAAMLKAAAEKQRFAIDSKCTTDAARILRTPGTLNEKEPGTYPDGRPVYVIDDSGPDFSPAELERILIKASANAAPGRPNGGTAAPGRGNGHDTNGAVIPIDHPPADPALIIKGCANMAHFAETGCAAPGEEPLWKACLGVMAFVENGDMVARNWSMKDERFDEAEFQKKIDARKKLSGASLCRQFHDECDEDSKTRCENCPHFDRIAEGKSPISLGYPSPEQQAQEELDKKNANVDPEILKLAALADDGRMTEFGAARTAFLKSSKCGADILNAKIKEYRHAEDPVEIEDEEEDVAPEDNAGDGNAPDGQGPFYVSWGKFRMSHKGLKFSKEDKTVWVSHPFEVLSLGHNPHGAKWGTYIRFRDTDGRVHLKYIPRALVSGEPGVLCQLLTDEGLTIDRSQYMTFARYLSRVKSPYRMTIVSRTGWHTVNDQRVFALPDTVIAPPGCEKIIFDDSTPTGPFASRGTLQDWKEHVGVLAKGQDLVMLSISTMLAGPLLDLVGAESGGLNFLGPSSTGKSSGQKAAAAVWGKGDLGGFVRSWNNTANGLEGAALLSNDTGLVLDERGSVQPRVIGQVIYAIFGGVGRGRADRTGAFREPKFWRTLVLSSSEKPIEAVIAEDFGKKTAAGQLVRLPDIPADRGLGFGFFNNGGHGDEPKANKKKSGEAFARKLQAAARKYYGTAGPEFVRCICKRDPDEVANQLNDDIDRFTTEVLGKEKKDADGQVYRVVRRIGLIAAAGEMATELDVTPWDKGEAWAAAKWAAEQWIANWGTGNAEEDMAVRDVRKFMENFSDSRFESADHLSIHAVPNRAGWTRGEEESQLWFIPPETWKSEVCKGHNAKSTARALARLGILEIQKSQKGDSFACSKTIRGKDMRVYVLNTKIFEAG